VPESFRARMAALLGPEVDAFLAALASPPTALRINTLRGDTERIRARLPWALEPLPFPRDGFLIGSEHRPGRHPFHAAGLFYLQDAGAMAVAALAAPQPGELVLDLAAAPGGKSTHIAALMGGEGVLVANDVQPARVRELVGNLERCGVGNTLVTQETAARLADRLGARFDRVLVDAPCSGEAMFHKSTAARDAWSEAVVLGCARRQREILDEAARLVRPGGLLLYSTCTFSPEEDEEVVARFLEGSTGWSVESLPAVPGAAPGRPDWVPEPLRETALERTLRLWPHRVPGAGHFVAALRRDHDAADLDSAGARVGGTPAARAARALWETFREDRIVEESSFVGGDLRIRGDSLYLIPEEAPPTADLRVERPGLWLGTVRRERFEPAHALAMALPIAGARVELDLSPDDPRTAAWLRGEVIREPGTGGWLRVTVDGFPLGWGKRTGDVVKNHYPKGLRATR
jgi:NOL1/NOP2/sun family putative RNA methylase